MKNNQVVDLSFININHAKHIKKKLILYIMMILPLKIKMRVFIYLPLFIVTLFVGCNSDNDDVIKPNLNHNYAGLEVGKFVVYTVDSIFFNDFNSSIDTFNFHVKEKIESQFIDLEGDEAYRIERFKKPIDSTNWVLTDVWSSKLATTNYQKVEENIRFIKLIFPIRINKNWNGNNKNNIGEQIYEYTAVHQPEVIGSFKLDSVSTILQFNDINLISQKFFEEKFATNIGLVYKKELNRERDSLNAPWLGKDVTMTLFAYGKE